jgi:hypothetical protein
LVWLLKRFGGQNAKKIFDLGVKIMKTLCVSFVCMFLFVVTCIVAQNVNSQWEKVDGSDVVGGITCYTHDQTHACTTYPSGDCTNTNAHPGTLGNCDYSAGTNEFTCPWVHASAQNATSYSSVKSVESGKSGYSSVSRFCQKKTPCNTGGLCTVLSSGGVAYGYCKNSSTADIEFSDVHEHYSTDGYSNCGQ